VAVNGTAGDRPGPRVAQVAQAADLPGALKTLGIGMPRPVLVLVGGAGGMTADQQTAMAEAMKQLVPALDRWGAAVVDGGTDSGVMQVMGQARDATGVSFPLIGVAAECTVTPSGTSPTGGTAQLEPHHTHVILVPGDSWGDESPWLSSVATALAGRQPSLTLVVNGGQLTYDDIGHSLLAGRPVIVLEGTGRTADAIAAAAGGQPGDPKAAQVAASREARIVPLSDPDAICSAIKSVLAPSA
jgi:SLOG in TRPM, prokaryote